jgi:ATP-dependent RNA helicase SUPV3L1/SUV3
VAPQLAALQPADRQALARLGIRLGRESVWFPSLLKEDATALKALLWATQEGCALPPVPSDRPLSLARGAQPESYYLAIGYRCVGPLAVRADALEQLAKAAYLLARQGPFAPTPALAAIIGGSEEALGGVLAGLGYRRRGRGTEATYVGRSGPAAEGTTARTRPGRKRRRRRQPRPADSPFASLKELRFGK